MKGYSPSEVRSEEMQRQVSRVFSNTSMSVRTKSFLLEIGSITWPTWWTLKDPRKFMGQSSKNFCSAPPRCNLYKLKKVKKWIFFENLKYNLKSSIVSLHSINWYPVEEYTFFNTWHTWFVLSSESWLWPESCLVPKSAFTIRTFALLSEDTSIPFLKTKVQINLLKITSTKWKFTWEVSHKILALIFRGPILKRSDF